MAKYESTSAYTAGNETLKLPLFSPRAAYMQTQPLVQWKQGFEYAGEGGGGGVIHTLVACLISYAINFLP